MPVPSPDEVFMIISSMTKLVKLGKNLKSHLSPSLSDAAWSLRHSQHGQHALESRRETSPIPATMYKQRHRVLIVSTSFLIRPSLWVGRSGEVEREGRGRGVMSLSYVTCVLLYRCTVSVGGEGGGRRIRQLSQL